MTYIRPLAKGMGEAVARRTYFRPEDNESMLNVGFRVAEGNVSLCTTNEDVGSEYEKISKYIAKGLTPTAGRHLQHGDQFQKDKNQELFTNCSTASTSFLLFYLLLCGSGVGRCYDTDLMVVDWKKLPKMIPVIDIKHPDYRGKFLTPQQAKYDYPDADVYTVDDSREGWAKCVEYLENIAFSGTHQGKVLLIDCNPIRPEGTPIKGMQGKPAPGPVYFMDTLMEIGQTIKLAHLNGMSSNELTLRIDHALSKCVVAGGSRRSSRIACVHWKDPFALKFVDIKKEGDLWSANNSILLDDAFYRSLKRKTKLAQRIARKMSVAAYYDDSGEPGAINVSNLNTNKEGIESMLEYAEQGELITGNGVYTVDNNSKEVIKKLAHVAYSRDSQFIVNPCIPEETWILTSQGPKQVKELVGTPFEAIVDGKKYLSETGFWKTGNKPVYKVSTNRGYSIEATGNHKILVQSAKKQKCGGGYNIETKWVEVQDLKEGHKIVLSENINFKWEGSETFEEGYLVGQVKGDGGFNPESYPTYMKFWGENQTSMASTIFNKVIKPLALNLRSDFKKEGVFNPTNKSTHFATKAFDSIVSNYLSPKTKELLPSLEKGSWNFYCGFIRGIFDADGTVLNTKEKGKSVRLAQSDLKTLEVVQRMLGRMGIASTIYKDRRNAGERPLPNGKGGVSDYFCEAQHELSISKDNIQKFHSFIGFYDPSKAAELDELVDSYSRTVYQDSFISEVSSIEFVGLKDVYDCNVHEIHAFDANGIVAHNCGEISLHVMGGYCVIADLAPYHSDSIEETIDAAKTMVRFLMRVNSMPSLYAKEVARTQRIGISLTGIQEWAWDKYGFTFNDLLDEEKSAPFWNDITRVHNAIREEADRYAKERGVNSPHTLTCIKPSGSVSKLYGISEGAHLPSMKWYLRNVQFMKSDPLVAEYIGKGYPVIYGDDLHAYKDVNIIGFPTEPEICKIMPEDKIVTAAQATLQEQYNWIKLLEKYWISGVEHEDDRGNQVSYTAKYKPEDIDYEDFHETFFCNQKDVRCFTVMPQLDLTIYEYQPEQPISQEEYESILLGISQEAEKEAIDVEHLKCTGGACPIDIIN